MTQQAAVLMNPRPIQLMPLEPVPIDNRHSAAHTPRRSFPSILSEYAANQHGIITRRQFADAGISPDRLSRWVRSGRIEVVLRGAYLLGRPLSHRGLQFAAVSSAGEGCVASHRSALDLWDLLKDDRAPRAVDVSVMGARRVRPRVSVHLRRRQTLSRAEITVRHGIPVTTVGRTLLDTAGHLGPDRVERLIAEAERDGLVAEREIRKVVARHAGHPGIVALRAVLSDPAGPQLTRSEAERECWKLLKSAGLPAPNTNVRIGPFEVDFLWPKENVALEVDGYEYHRHRARFEGDRQKDNWLRAQGVDIVRVTWHQIVHRPVPTAVVIAQALTRAAARLSARRREEDPLGDPGSTG
jgi:very-short-patch-repair endonuclease/predicted transcriptional regulator of viral defense system